MTIYGEDPNQFRPRPSSLALASVSLFTAIAGALLGSSIFAIARVFGTRYVRPEFPIVVYLPFASDPSSGLYPLRSDFAVLGAAPAIAAPTLLALVLLLAFPTTQKLSSRLTLHTIVSTLIAFGSLAPLLDLELLARFRVFTGIDPAPALAIFVALALLFVLLIAMVERRAYLILSNIYLVDTPARRLLLWVVRIPIAFFTLGIVCILNGWIGGAVASICVIVATLIETISHLPGYRFEQLTQVEMREAAATWPLVAAALVALSVWAFGSAALQLPRRVVTFETARPALAPLERTQDTQREKFEPKIEMKWSKPRK